MILLRLNHSRRVEVGLAVGVGRAIAGVDGGVDRHAGAQQVLLRHVFRHANPDRQPLHDLGEMLSTTPANLRWP